MYRPRWKEPRRTIPWPWRWKRCAARATRPWTRWPPGWLTRRPSPTSPPGRCCSSPATTSNGWCERSRPFAPSWPRSSPTGSGGGSPRQAALARPHRVRSRGVAAQYGVGGEHGLGHPLGLTLGGGVAEDGRQERLLGERVHHGVGVGGDGGRAGDGPQEGDLPDPLATPAPPYEVPVLGDVQLSRGDRVVGVPLVALPDEYRPGRHLSGSEGGREALQRRSGQ